MAVYADNIKNKLGTLPSYKPSAADTFGDWSVEIGDIIPVYPDLSRQQLEKSQLQSLIANSLPVMNSDMSWNGAAQTTVECTGTAEREVQKKEERQSYTYENDVAKKLASYGGRLDNDETYIREVKTIFEGDGTSASAGLLAYLNFGKDGKPNGAYTSISSAIDGRIASVTAITTKDQWGKVSTLIDMQADLTRIKGALSVSETGTILGDVVMGGKLGVDGLITAHDGLKIDGGTLAIGTDTFEKRSVTVLSSFTQALAGDWGHQAQTTTAYYLASSVAHSETRVPDWGAEVRF